MSFCRDLCDGVAGNVRNCMTAPITRTKLYWAGGISLFIILFVVILCVSLPRSSSGTNGRQALYDSPFSVGINYIPSESHNKKNVADFDKELVKYVSESPIKVQLFGARANCSSQYKDAVAQTIDQVDYLARLMPVLGIRPAVSLEEVQASSGNGVVSGLIAVNGGHSLGLQLSTLRTYYKMGVRILSITSVNCTTPWAKATTNLTTVDHTLTDFGKAVVHEANRLGMLIDIAGADVETQGLVIETSKAPVVAIGIGLKSVKTDLLNLDQNIVAKFKAANGLLMLTMDCNLIATDMKNCTASDFTKMLKQAKEDNIRVGIGGAFKADVLPKGMSFKEMPEYFDALHKKEGFSMDFLRGLSGDSFLQTLKRVEDEAKNSQEVKPEEMLFDKTKLDSTKQLCYSDLEQPSPKVTPIPTPTPSPKTDPTSSPKPDPTASPKT